MNIIEFFSGLGSQAKALENVGIEYKLLNTCEWNINSIVAYDYIHNGATIIDEVNSLNRAEIIKRLNGYTLSIDGKQPINQKFFTRATDESLKRILSSIIKSKNLVDITAVNGADLPNDTDLLTYSFPCQDLSNAGSIHGFKAGIDRNAGSRSGLLWEVERILLERIELNLPLPKFLLLENVAALDSKRHKENFDEWKLNLENMGYVNKPYKLNSKDFGLPQSRNRIIMVSVLVENEEQRRNVEEYFSTHDLGLKEYRDTLDFKKLSVSDCLRTNYNNKLYYNEALDSQPNDTPSRRKMWENNPKIIDEKGNINISHIATITTKQDRHPNAGNIFFDVDNNKSKYRLLSPRECFLFMGFSEKDFNNIIENNFNFSNHKPFFTKDILRKMAGNSIAVNVLMEVFKQIEYIKKNLL